MIIIDAKQRRKVLRVTQYQSLYDYYKNYIDILKIVDFDENADFSKKYGTGHMINKCFEASQDEI